MKSVSDTDRLDGERIEEALADALERMTGAGCPPRLGAALRHAVLGRGHRLRPRLLRAVCRACTGEVSPLAERAGTAVELVHSASLVHDDLPCFDDAAERRGAPSVHRAFGETLAVLAGDALIFGAFAELGLAASASPEATGRLVALLAEAAGTPRGITAGQGWESEETVDVERYHAAKTASLFEAAAAGGALAAGADPGPFRELGRSLGMVYQAADDVRDRIGSSDELGKPVGRDEALGRPSVVRARGLEAALIELDRRTEAARAAVPPCPGRDGLAAFVARLLAGFQP